VPVTETHGLCLGELNGKKCLFIADVGAKHGAPAGSPQVVFCDLEGKVLKKLTKDYFPHAEGEVICPTTVAWNLVNKDIWITDGYGSSKVFRFNSKLEHLGTLDGVDGAGRFKCPPGPIEKMKRARWFLRIKTFPKENSTVPLLGFVKT
jgi:hypothetical protein